MVYTTLWKDTKLYDMESMHHALYVRVDHYHGPNTSVISVQSTYHGHIILEWKFQAPE